MDTRKVTLFCYWNGFIKDGPDGPFYEGSSPRAIRVDSKIELSQLFDELHQLTGFEKENFQIDLIGRYPSIVQQSMVKFIRFPVVDDCSLEIMLEVPRYNPSINYVDLYLEVKPVARKRSRQDDTNGYADDVNVNVRDNKANTNGWIEDDEDMDDENCILQDDTNGYADDVNVNVRDNEANTNGWIEDDEDTDDENCRNDGYNAAVQKDSGLIDCASKQLFFSRSWLDERELHVGMFFRDKGELEKAVKLYSNRRQREYIADEGTLEFMCKKRKVCGWVLKAAETKSNGFEIIEYTDPHTCKPVDVGSDFLAAEIESLIKAQPLLSVPELDKWLREDFGYSVSGEILWSAVKKATTAILGDLEKSFSVLPKLMAALYSSNKMLVEWQYDLSPDPKDASFRSVFWAFQQSVEGFPHCRPLIIVDTVDLSGKYPWKMLVAGGVDTENVFFPLAFAIITQENLSAETWRWFFACIRKKVTQREGLCLITSLDPDIVAVVQEPECQWAQHRFCIRHLCYKFYEVFNNNLMTEFVYKAGSTKHISSFYVYLNRIEKMNPGARKWLEQIPLYQWALAHDKDGLRFGIMNTKLIFTSYGFVNKDRDIPITTCILLIFNLLAELFKWRHDLLEESQKKREEVYVNRVMKKLEGYKEASRTHYVLPLDQTGQRFKVTEVGKIEFLVNRSDRACTCGIWQVYKYPCSHVLAVCSYLNIDHLQYVNDFYKTECFHGVYAAVFTHLPGLSDWPEASDVPRLFPPGSHRVDKPVTIEPPRNDSAQQNTGPNEQSETRRSERPKKPNQKYN